MDYCRIVAPELGDRCVGADRPLQTELCRSLLVSHPRTLEVGWGGLARHLDSGSGLAKIILGCTLVLAVDLCVSWKMINVWFSIQSTSERTLFTFTKTE